MKRTDKNGKIKRLNINIIFDNKGPNLINILKEEYLKSLKNVKR